MITTVLGSANSFRGWDRQGARVHFGVILLIVPHFLWPLFGIKGGSDQDKIHAWRGSQGGLANRARWHRIGQGAVIQ